MASNVASELILFITSLLVAGMVAGGLYVVTQDISDGITVRGKDLAYNLRLNFEIINDPENIPTDNTGAYIFYIKNIGKVPFTFESNSIIIFIDGNMIPSSNLTFVNLNNPTSNQLYPYDVGEIHVATFLSSGYHRIVVVLSNGKQRALIFRIG